MEIERKLLLADREAWRALAGCLRGLHLLHQDNHFLDDTESAWRAAALAVRVRVVDDCAWLTLKGAATSADGFQVRSEWEGELTLSQRRTLLAGGPAATSLVIDWMQTRGLTAPPEIRRPLRVVASFPNVRGLGWWMAADGEAWEIALDESHYPDGSVVHELELELHDADADAALRALEELLRCSSVQARPSTVSKRQRLGAALGEPNDESRP